MLALTGWSFIYEKGMILSEDLTAVILAEGKNFSDAGQFSSGLRLKNEAKKWGRK